MEKTRQGERDRTLHQVQNMAIKRMDNVAIVVIDIAVMRTPDGHSKTDFSRFQMPKYPLFITNSEIWIFFDSIMR